ncbi:MAG TPA: hypothetical protein VNJ70_06610 [Thermoanaerobaculia bacterium]|nr:hypothetical protein [Thermoanaerobaculia bacterium]
MNRKSVSRPAAALALAAVLALAVPPPASAIGRGGGRAARLVDGWMEAAWGWVGGVLGGLTARWGAQGTSIDPNGPPPTSQCDQGTSLDPNGCPQRP